MTNLVDILGLALLFFLGVSCAVWGLMLLHKEDERRNRSSQCPPHKWGWQENTLDNRLQCAKCGLRLERQVPPPAWKQ